MVEANAGESRVKPEAEPDRCELCDCCRKSRVLTRSVSITDLTAI